MKRKLTPCAAVKAGKATCRGRTTIEWYDKDGDPQKYCYGYIDKMTDEYLDVCRNCPELPKQRNCSNSCEECRREYWNQEVE